MDVQQVRREAVARVLARQRPPEYKIVGRNPDGSDIRMQERGWPGDFLGPVSIAEWFDDRIARRTPVPGRAGEVLFAIALAGREGRGAAVEAVRQARSLGAWDQWAVHRNLVAWQCEAAQPDASPVMGAIIREWERLGLLTRVPDEPIPVRTLNQAELDESDRRRRSRRAAPVYTRAACDA